MKADEKGNKFTLLWVKGLFEYTKDVLHPKYLTSRREFEKHLSSEERSLISYVREKVKEFYKDRLQKDYSDHHSTEMESNRVWVARANLMPSIGPKKTKKLEKDLNRIAVQYSEILNVCYAKLKEADIASREFTANFYEEIGGTYGPNVMVHREEEERAEELWKMNFLLVDPNHKPE
ncbi:MAG: hypothetical protein KTR30_13820 [Saprospiraceae bacterium]|nr:hypothetical protein [Saprospiraceae bacterium]